MVHLCFVPHSNKHEEGEGTTEKLPNDRIINIMKKQN